jgi:hypothetical protein
MSSARRAITALAIAVVLAIAGLLLVALTDDREVAFTLGVRPTAVAAVLEPGRQVCQRPIDAAGDARHVRVRIGTNGAPGPRLGVRARAAGGGSASGVVPAGYGDLSSPRAHLDRELRDGDRIEVCLANLGKRRVTVYGGPAQAARPSAAYEGGRRLATDIALVFEREHDRSALALVPAALERSVLFKPGWLDQRLLGAVILAFMVGVPLLLAGALRAALRG